MMTTDETLAELFRERVRLSPEAPAYQVFDHARGERVALMLENGPDWIAIDLAVQGLGLVSVPLYVDDRPDNVALILREIGARILLLQNGLQWSRLAPVLAEEDAATLKRIVTLRPLATDDPRVVDLDAWCAQAAAPPTPRPSPRTIWPPSSTLRAPRGGPRA
jgi:long-chain acyl-CoA synthetase